MNSAYFLSNFFVIAISIVSYNFSKPASYQETQNKKSKQNKGSIKLEDVWNSEGSMNLSEIATSIEYIPLKMNDDPLSALPESKRLFIIKTKDHFIIYDKGSSVHVFSDSGEFLRRIGRQGRGPGEFLEIAKIIVTNDENQLWLFDNSRKKMIRYEISGRLINEFTVDKKSSQFAIDPAGDIYVLDLEVDMSLMDASKIVVYDNEGKVKDSFSLYKDRRLGVGYAWGRRSILNYVNGAIEHCEPPFDTVFRYENESWKAIWGIDCGSNRIPFEAYSERTFNQIFRPYSFISTVLETPEYFFIKGVNKQSIKEIIVNKSASTAQLCDFNTDKVERAWRFKGLINDLDGGIPFWPSSVYKDEYLIAMIDAIVLIDFEPAITEASQVDPKHRAKLDKLIGSLNPEDNLIAMVVKLK